MAAATLARPAENWPTLPEREGYEYLDGKWVKIPMGNRSVDISANLYVALRQHVRPNRLGTVFAHETNVQMWPGQPRRYRKPDGGFISADRFPVGALTDEPIHIPPDLVIEVASKWDRGWDLDEKVREYLVGGVRLVWLVYPNTRTVVVYRADGTAARVGPEDTLTGEDVIPGFSLRVGDLL